MPAATGEPEGRAPAPSVPDLSQPHCLAPPAVPRPAGGVGVEGPPRAPADAAMPAANGEPEERAPDPSVPKLSQPRCLALPAAPRPAGGPPETAQLVFGDCVLGMRALPDSSIDLLIADPPYDIGVQKSAWDTVPHYLEWSRTWLAEARRVLKPAGQLFIYGSPAKLWICRLNIIAADEFGFEFKQHISWCYNQGGDSRFAGMAQYAVRMEHLEWFVKPTQTGAGQPAAAHTFNAEEAAEHYTPEDREEALAKGVGRVTSESLDKGRPPRNWVEVPRENSRSVERRYGAHPSMKPLKLCERLVRVHSNPGERVLIPFSGSGSEVVTAAKLGRQVVCFENDAEYHAIIVRRLSGHGVPVVNERGLPVLPTAAAPAAEATPEFGSVQKNNRFQSGYMGVFKHGKRYVAKIRLAGRLVNIGTFDDAAEAAVAYQRRAVEEGLAVAPATAPAAVPPSGVAEGLATAPAAPEPLAPAAPASAPATVDASADAPPAGGQQALPDGPPLAPVAAHMPAAPSPAPATAPATAATAAAVAGAPAASKLLVLAVPSAWAATAASVAVAAAAAATAAGGGSAAQAMAAPALEQGPPKRKRGRPPKARLPPAAAATPAPVLFAPQNPPPNPPGLPHPLGLQNPFFTGGAPLYAFAHLPGLAYAQLPPQHFGQPSPQLYAQPPPQHHGQLHALSYAPVVMAMPVAQAPQWTQPMSLSVPVVGLPAA
ncbi:S-adenosyl-L-methionine-dependent methyltransferase [Pavlovales sp. CCMP2436]|nr:S-adenosyl-L-methionine-dependent methyltransferase [Pavlovales sp. CCMP2436]